jgi:phage terminase large subunit
MRRSGLYPREVNKGSGSIIRGIDAVRSLIRENRFKVFNTCKHTIDEFSVYHYPEEGEVKDEEPVKEYDDAMDAIRYAVFTYQPVKQIIPIYERPIKNPAR